MSDDEKLDLDLKFFDDHTQWATVRNVQSLKFVQDLKFRLVPCTEIPGDHSEITVEVNNGHLTGEVQAVPTRHDDSFFFGGILAHATSALRIQLMNRLVYHHLVENEEKIKPINHAGLESELSKYPSAIVLCGVEMINTALMKTIIKDNRTSVTSVNIHCREKFIVFEGNAESSPAYSFTFLGFRAIGKSLVAVFGVKINTGNPAVVLKLVDD